MDQSSNLKQKEGRRGETERHEKRRDTHAKHIALGH